jgi:ketosteroid isomerase-like protein
MLAASETTSMTRRKLYIPVCLLALSLLAEAQPPNLPKPSPAEAAVRQVLDAQVIAWNKGDLEGYMAGYWKSPDLVFYSGGTRTQGWDATLARYRRRYQEGGKEMGQLELRNMEVQLLGRDAALARGEWHLTMKDGSQPHGRPRSQLRGVRLTVSRVATRDRLRSWPRRTLSPPA